MNKPYEISSSVTDVDYYFILTRRLYGEGKIERAVDKLSAKLNCTYIEASDLCKFESWLGDSVAGLQAIQGRHWDIRFAINPLGIDYNGVGCRKYTIYRVEKCRPSDICYVYLYKTYLRLELKGGEPCTK